MSETREGKVTEVSCFDNDSDEVQMVIWLDHGQPCGIGEDKSDAITITMLTPPRTFAARDEIEVVFRKVNEDT